ncbi:MAG: aspartate/glutamate racemase [Devosia sp. 67-54]|uniref:aspartate/glutamate racemase family protein n=1 Tax=unclassified Devosia TaxID=196773 RepID=UPI00086B85D8|nr:MULTISPECIES: aspartate/glutamate racemase family protein [unclassified Devosia]MBN9307190.1 aspartate/glutamate racemase family protein [Devosia sp.]ODU62064.1 MAG: aspartate/glutamate racemase [Pelagibacterium sp. SCN 68-10]OJX19586.1 MAG: aspartate/glutamate racemase [Devosia sp. 67-54]
MKSIGLIGGMSWESTAHYYAVLNRETAARLGGLHSAPVIVYSVDFAPIEAMQRQGAWDAAGAELARIAQGLEAQGCGVIGLATNTMHICAPQIEAALTVPFLHIATPTANALIADGIVRVGLLGTRFTMEKRFYIDVLERHGLEVLVPDVGVTNLNGIIYEELVKGIVREESRRLYVDAIARLQARGADAVILGCTEIGMLIDDAVSPLPTYDTTALHATALVEAALN